MNLQNNMNKIENQNKPCSLKFSIKNKNIITQCCTNFTFEKVLKNFYIKLGESNNFKYYFFFKGKKIDNDQLTLDEYGINDNDEIIVVEKNDKNKIDNIIKEFPDPNSSIQLFFVVNTGLRLNITYHKKITVGEAFVKYFQRIGINNTDKIIFLFNAQSLLLNDNRTLKKVFHNNSQITVIDPSNLIGA